MSFTSIPNANLQVGAPLRSIDILALRDNILAVPNGEPGAPKIKAAALDGGASGAAPIFAARAWVNFDGTTPDPSTIRGSGNVSSIIKDETGVFRIQFTIPMQDVNFAAVAVASGEGGAAFRIVTVSQYLTTEVVLRSANVPAAASLFPQPEDADTLCLAIFR